MPIESEIIETAKLFFQKDPSNLVSSVGIISSLNTDESYKALNDLINSVKKTTKSDTEAKEMIEFAQKVLPAFQKIKKNNPKCFQFITYNPDWVLERIQVFQRSMDVQVFCSLEIAYKEIIIS